MRSCPVSRDLVGYVFGRLTVVGRATVPSKPWQRWLCHCECGNEVATATGALTDGLTQSCGCLHRDRMLENPPHLKHGHTVGRNFSVEYKAWQSMLHRVRGDDPRHKIRYVDRGIKACDRWLGSEGFENFLADMGPKPSPKHTLDRINNDGGYEPGNCRWATWAVQRRNRGGCRLVTYDGKTQTVTDWAEQIGIKPATLYARLNSGWPVKETLSTPTRSHR